MKKSIIPFTLVILIILIGSVALLTGCTKSGPSPSAGGTGIPDFTVTDLAGNTFDTKALRGKILVINFWATWCGPCRAEMPDIERVYKQLGNDAVFIAIDVPEEGMTPDRMKTFLKENGFTFPVALDDAQKSVADMYRVSAIPTTLFVDPAGKIYYKQTGAFSSGEEILKKVEEIRKKVDS